jgi:hypothetical protein
MKRHAFLSTVILGVVASLTSVHAQSPDPCTLYTCMAGMPGVVGLSGGPGCSTAIAFWHAPAPAGLAVYHPPQGFNPPASAALRRTYMSTCAGANAATNAAILQTIISEYGYLP